jgi:hypothetical protein
VSPNLGIEALSLADLLIYFSQLVFNFQAWTCEFKVSPPRPSKVSPNLGSEALNLAVFFISNFILSVSFSSLDL